MRSEIWRTQVQNDIFPAYAQQYHIRYNFYRLKEMRMIKNTALRETDCTL